MKSNKCLQKAFKISAPENWVGGGRGGGGRSSLSRVEKKNEIFKIKVGHCLQLLRAKSFVKQKGLWVIRNLPIAKGT